MMGPRASGHFENGPHAKNRQKGLNLVKNAIIKKMRLRENKGCGYTQTNVIGKLLKYSKYWNSSGTERNVTLLRAS